MVAVQWRGGGAGRGSEGGEEKEASAWRRGGEARWWQWRGKRPLRVGVWVCVGSAPLAGRRAPRTA